MNKAKNTKIIMDGFKSDPPLSDDDMLQQLYEAKVPFSELRTVFNEIVSEKGLRLSNKERKIKTIDLMGETEKVEDAEEMLKIVSMLQEKLKVTSTKALGSLRTWAKDRGITLPKVPKLSKPRKVGFGGHYEKILDHVLALRTEAAEKGEEAVIDKKAIVAFCHSANIPEAYATVSLNVIHFAKVWSGEIVPEVTEEETEEETETAEAA